MPNTVIQMSVFTASASHNFCLKCHMIGDNLFTNSYSVLKMNIFRRPVILDVYFMYMFYWFLNFFCVLVVEKITDKFLIHELH